MNPIALIMAYVSFLISPFSLIAFGLGIIGFFSLPVISKATNYKQPSKFMFWLGKQPLKRMAIVVSEHNDVYFKRMSFSDLGFEQIRIGKEKKDFEDPDSALHYWLGLPFAFADEKHGVLFDPRHAALGKREHDADEKGINEFKATESEWKDYGISRWKKGTYEMPKINEIVDLSFIHHYVDGGERAEYGEHVEERYKHSRDPFEDGHSTLRVLLPIVALVLGFGAMWFFASQGSDGGSGSVVSFNALLLLLSVPTEKIQETVRAYSKEIVAGIVSAVGFVVLVLVLLGTGGAFFTIAFLGTLLWGFLFMPFLAFATKPIGPLGGTMSNLFFKLGILGYTKPVLEWTPAKYRLRELDNIDHENRPTWYNLWGSIIGFTFAPEPDSWGAETMEDIEEKKPVEGEKADDSFVPEQFVLSDMERGGMGLLLPKSIKRSKYYLNRGIALARFNDSAVGERAHKRLQKAKDDHGEGNNDSENRLMIMTAVLGSVGFIAGLVVFFIL